MTTPLDITCLHVNSIAKVAHSILGEPHWLLQLQTAVRYRVKYAQELAEAEEEYARSIQELKNLGNEEAISTATRLGLERLQLVCRDVRFLLKAASDLEEKIWSQAIVDYPELTSATYEEAQLMFSDAAFDAIAARLYSRSMMAQTLNISEANAELLLQMSEERRQTVLQLGAQELETVGIFVMQKDGELEAGDE